MDVRLWAVLIGVISGALGYWFSTFHMQPILRFRQLRNQVLIDFIYFAQVINAEGLSDEMKNLYRERILANRQISAKLTAATQELPTWYLWVQKWKKRNPARAAKRLIGYSNTEEYETAHQIEASIRKDLGLPPES